MAADDALIRWGDASGRLSSLLSRECLAQERTTDQRRQVNTRTIRSDLVPHFTP